MNQQILTSISVDELTDKLRSVVSEELIKVKEREDLEKLLSPSETCNLFSPKISKTTLSTWTARGLLASIGIGGRVYYRKGDVLNRVAAMKRRGGVK